MNAITTKTNATREAGQHYDNQKILVMSRWGWGIGANETEAKRKCLSNTPRAVRERREKVTTDTYAIHPDTEIFGDGSWEYPKGCAPVKL